MDLTPWQKGKLHELGIDTIGELIDVEENKLKEARYIADVRARQMKNAAVAAVCEYLLGLMTYKWHTDNALNTAAKKS